MALKSDERQRSPKSNFREISESLDLRLLQQYRPVADIQQNERRRQLTRLYSNLTPMRFSRFHTTRHGCLSCSLRINNVKRSGM